MMDEALVQAASRLFPLVQNLLLEACCPPSVSPAAPGSFPAGMLDSVILPKEDMEANTKTHTVADSNGSGHLKQPHTLNRNDFSQCPRD